MRKTLLFIPVFLAIFLFSSCDKDNSSVNVLEGTWKLTSTSGGFSGGGFDAEFDYIIIDKNLNFKLEKDGNEIGNGHIEELELDTTQHSFATFYIQFIEDENFINQPISLLSDNEKYVIFNDGDMSLNSPCCDRYDFYFEKE